MFFQYSFAMSAPFEEPILALPSDDDENALGAVACVPQGLVTVSAGDPSFRRRNLIENCISVS